MPWQQTIIRWLIGLLPVSEASLEFEATGLIPVWELLLELEAMLLVCFDDRMERSTTRDLCVDVEKILIDLFDKTIPRYFSPRLLKGQLTRGRDESWYIFIASSS